MQSALPRFATRSLLHDEMVIKESSDELNPPVIAADSVLATPRPARSTKDSLALAIATCGVGYLPLAPGTWGSLVAVGLYFLVRVGLSQYPADSAPPVGPYSFLTGELVVIVAITLVGIWAASRTERVLKIKDPGKVVVDEVAGQLIALLPLPLTRIGPWPVLVIIAFLLFRFFDIVKPYPARKFELLSGGLGIMADDLVAGAYAAVIVAIVVALGWFT
jgi:phosphatidylglycerophosphatase A